MTRVDWTICLLALLASSSPARADQDAAAARPSLPPSGLTLARGALSVLTTAEINLAKDVAGEPISIAPDIGYGVTDDLTLVLVHSSFGTTGFRGAAGGGVCVTGEDGGCPRPYANAGLEGQVGLLRGPLSIAAVGGVHAAFRRDMAGDDLDLFILKLGARTRWTAGNLVVLFTPSFFIGLNERDANKESIWLPVAVGYKVVPPLTVGLGSGINGPVEHFGDSYRVPIGAWTNLAIGKRANAGASFTFGRIAGGSTLSDADQTGPDFRVLQLWFGYVL